MSFTLATVTVTPHSLDRYKRILGDVYLDELHVNAWLVEQGYAWVYRKYSKDPHLLSLEAKAKSNKRGLWAADYPVPPWECRREKREGRKIEGKASD